MIAPKPKTEASTSCGRIAPAHPLNRQCAARALIEYQPKEVCTPDKALHDLFLDTLKDIYCAETQILKTLPKMAQAAQLEELRARFEEHRPQTEGHVDRLEQIFELLGVTARGKTCEDILGITEEDKEIMDEFKGTSALDAGLISSGQAIEHYKIARYGTLKTWAGTLGMKEAATLLDATLPEEIATDKKLWR